MEEETVPAEGNQSERNRPGAGIPFRGMPPVPPPGSCHLLKIPELSQLASPAGDQAAFLIIMIKCPREDLKMKIYFSSRLHRAQV